VRVENPDLLDRTPILDLKPYIPHTEARPDARSGWIAGLHERTEPLYRVRISRHVRTKLRHQAGDVRSEIIAYLLDVLSRDPLPHAYRRIRKAADRTFTIAVGYWRCTYHITGRSIRVTDADRSPD